MAGGSGQADSGQQQSNGASPWQQAALRGSRARSPASSGRGSGGGGGRAARSSTAGGRFVRKDHPPREFEGPSSDFEIPSAKAFGADFGGEYELSTAHATQNQQLGEPELQDARSTIAGVKSQYGTASPDETASSENHKLPDQTSNVGYLVSSCPVARDVAAHFSGL